MTDLYMRISAAALVAGLAAVAPGVPAQQGNPFKSMSYESSPLPRFAQTKDKLPAPIYDENPLYVRMYWKAWELAFRNFHEPAPRSGFVSQFIDASFNENIFLWDSCFMTMFTSVAHPLVPGIGSLDNFYAKQHDDGEICREIDRTTGRDGSLWVNDAGKDLFSRYGTDYLAKGFDVTYVGRDTPRPAPKLTLDGLNHPILAWAEIEHFRLSGDRSRLGRVYGPLASHYGAMKKYLRQGNGLYMTDWASMDNSPRNDHLVGGGTAVDTSAEMVMFANQLGEIAESLQHRQEAASYRAEAAELARTINARMWSPARKFYFDLDVNGQPSSVKTIAAYWTLLAGVASPQQAEALAAELRNPRTFGRHHPVPTLAADEKGFDPAGGYWRGAVWAPTNTMVIRGLEKYGKTELAASIARQHLKLIAEVFARTDTIWENYAPDAAVQGRPAKPDFVGWSGIGPILYFFEFEIGIKGDGASGKVVWNLTSPQRVGIEKYRFGGREVNLVCGPADASGRRLLKASGDQPFVLVVHWKGRQTTLEVGAGKELAVRL